MAARIGRDALAADPVRFARRYEHGADREVVALISALFAYGNVKSMGAFLERLLACLGPSPHRSLMRGGVKRVPGPYRFQTRRDVARFLDGLGALLAETGSLESAFEGGARDIEDRLESLALRLRQLAGRLTPGLAHLLPLPSSGSACKRWWMFLRWVVRPDDGVDLGLWTCAGPGELRIPVDTHIARIAYALRLSERRTPDRLFSMEVTRALAEICPEDPTRYDFTLAHMGILKACPRHQVASICEACSLRPHCRLAKK